MDNQLSLRKNVLGLICLVITAGILVAGLWPFSFRPENKVRWLPDQNGLHFYGQSIVFSNLPSVFAVSTRNTELATRNNHLVTTIPSFHPSNIPEKSLSIVLRLQSTTDSLSHLGHIFSFLDDRGAEVFFIAQWRSHLLLGKGVHGKKAYREMGIKDALKKDENPLVTITSGSDGTNIYVNGILMKSSSRFHLFSRNEKPSGRIVLGNSPKGGEYWTGNLLSLATYDRVLTGEDVFRYSRSEGSKEEGLIARYLFDERSGTVAHDSVGGHHLAIPSRFEVLKKTVLVPPWEDFKFNRSYLMDIATNILGFIPFGFFLSVYLRMRKPHSNLQLLFLSVVIACGLSLSIELIQIYLPTRTSQLTDVITNTIGAAIGAVLSSKMQATQKLSNPSNSITQVTQATR